MKISQLPKFIKAYKKLYANQLDPVEDAIETIFDNPTIGTEKKGDLTGVRVYKFKVLDQEFLLAYKIVEDTIILCALGTHENFYRDMK